MHGAANQFWPKNCWTRNPSMQGATSIGQIATNLDRCILFSVYCPLPYSWCSQGELTMTSTPSPESDCSWLCLAIMYSWPIWYYNKKPGAFNTPTNARNKEYFVRDYLRIEMFLMSTLRSRGQGYKSKFKCFLGKTLDLSNHSSLGYLINGPIWVGLRLIVTRLHLSTVNPVRIPPKIGFLAQ